MSDEELIECARAISEHCEKTQCKDCVFCKSRNTDYCENNCFLSGDNSPCDWGKPPE
jgi:putative hemolysin